MLVHLPSAQSRMVLSPDPDRRRAPGPGRAARHSTAPSCPSSVCTQCSPCQTRMVLHPIPSCQALLLLVLTHCSSLMQVRSDPCPSAALEQSVTNSANCDIHNRGEGVHLSREADASRPSFKKAVLEICRSPGTHSEHIPPICRVAWQQHRAAAACRQKACLRAKWHSMILFSSRSSPASTRFGHDLLVISVHGPSATAKTVGHSCY